LDPRPKIDYDAIAPAYAAHREASSAVVDHLAERLSDAAIGSVLEMGCGTGDYLAALVQRMKLPGVGFDHYPEMLRQGRRKHAGVPLVRADAQGPFPFEDESFELCLSVNLIHYLGNLRAFFAEAYRVAKVGALVVTVTDAADDIERRTMSEYFPETLPIELERYPCLCEVRSAMQEAKWRPVGATHIERSFPLERADLEKYESKAYSALRLIPQACFEAGIARLRSDLAKGGAMLRELYTCLWGRK
jgi:SAM-dependent methyltransferase